MKTYIGTKIIEAVPAIVYELNHGVLKEGAGNE